MGYRMICDCHGKTVRFHESGKCRPFIAARICEFEVNKVRVCSKLINSYWKQKFCVDHRLERWDAVKTANQRERRARARESI